MSIQLYNFHLRDGLGMVTTKVSTKALTRARAGDEAFQNIVLGHVEFTYEKWHGKRVRLTSWDQIEKITRTADAKD